LTLTEIEVGLRKKLSPSFQAEVAQKAKQTVSGLRRAANLEPDVIRALPDEDRQAILALAQAILERYGEA